MWTIICVLIVCLQLHIIEGQTATSAVSDGNDNDKCQFIHGRDGAAGRDGRDGIIGPQGPPGFPGFPGHKGGQGEQGKFGPRGQKGETGDTITSTGPRGLTGPHGIQGPKGSRGSLGQKGERGSLSALSGGVLYTRWGKTTCRSGANLVYSGRAGTSYAGHSGGGSNYLCMPNDPAYTLSYTPGVQGYSSMYGVEYEASAVPNRNNHNARCAVCLVSNKEVSLMIPAKTSCPSGWTREYYGYLMSEHLNRNRTEFVCVDAAMDSVPGSQNNIASGHFYHVEGHCDGVPCPPYNNYKELNCVVCTK